MMIGDDLGILGPWKRLLTACENSYMFGYYMRPTLQPPIDA